MPSSADCPALARRLRHEAPTHISWLQLQTGAQAPWHEPPSPIPHMSPHQRPPSQNLSVTNAANSRLESFLFPSTIFEQRNQRSNVCPSEQQSYDKHPQTPPCAAPKSKRKTCLLPAPTAPAVSSDISAVLPERTRAKYSLNPFRMTIIFPSIV